MSANGSYYLNVSYVSVVGHTLVKWLLKAYHTNLLPNYECRYFALVGANGRVELDREPGTGILKGEAFFSLF